MTRKIPKIEWGRFFNELNRDRSGWQTSIQVLNNDSGAQMLSVGLPFCGLTYETSGGHDVIELAMGGDKEVHQTHNIIDPRVVCLLFKGTGPGGTLDIEDASGTKILINFVQPMPALAKRGSEDILTVR
jgi:hypothetical protein